MLRGGSRSGHQAQRDSVVPVSWVCGGMFPPAAAEPDVGHASLVPQVLGAGMVCACLWM